MFVLIHGTRQYKQYIRRIEIGYTGIDITYCDNERIAMRFISRAVAIHVAKGLICYGTFFPKEVNE